MPNTTNFNWTTPADTDLVKDGASAIRTLGNSIDTSFVDLKGGTSGQVLAKNSNTDLDFTWVAQDDSNAIQNAIVDAKGDLISATAADTPARLGVGTNGQVLTADSTTSTGLKWATAASGGITLIQDTVASGNSAIDFSSISGTYKHLFLTWHGLYTSADGSFFSIRLNSDSGSNYVRQGFYYEAPVSTAPTFAIFDGTGDNLDAFVNQGSNSANSKTAFGYINIYNYASTTRTKKFESDYFYWSNNNSRYNRLTQQGYWNSTSAITSVNIFRGNGTATLSNITNSSIQLWGVS